MHYIELDQFIGRDHLVTVHGPLDPAVGPDVALRETSSVLARIVAGRLRPSTSFELSRSCLRWPAIRRPMWRRYKRRGRL